MNRTVLLTFLLLMVAHHTMAQIVVKGQVFDITTFQPIDLCNVYIVGTSMGASTDTTGHFSFEVAEPGSYELVFSHVGYRPELIDIQVAGDSAKIDPMPLNPNTNYMQEVVVDGKKDKKWQRQYDRFINYAMGKHYRERNVEVVNPYVVEFKNSGRGMLTEAQPFTLTMRNEYTGYEINFLVQRLFLSKSNQFMIGYPGFAKLTSDDSEKLALWKENRQKSYLGSLRHFFQALLKNELSTNGFDVQLTEKDGKKFTGAAAQILPLNVDNTINLNSENLFEYILVTDTEDPRIKKLTFDKLLRATYRNEQDSFGKPQQTLIEAIDGEVLIYTNGIPVNPTSLKLYGYLASEGLYEMLPFEYELSK